MVCPRTHKAFAAATCASLAALAWIATLQNSAAQPFPIPTRLLPTLQAGLDDKLERGRGWLSARVDRLLRAGETGTDRVALAMAVAALGRHGDPRDAELVARARERLAETQRADGSFGEAAHAVRDTWLGLAALRGEAAYERARVFLDDVDGPATSPEPGGGGAGEALDFLSSTRTNRRSAEPSPGQEELFALAGGRFDARAALRHLRSADALADVRLTTALELPDLGAVHELHLAARILGQTGRPRLIMDDGRQLAWPLILMDAIDAHWRPEVGAWGTGEGAPDVRATSSALLAWNVLHPWAALPQEMMDGLEAAEPRLAAELGDDCEQCHERLSPGLHYQWERSAHADSNVGCASCHGENHSLIFREEGRVSAAVCGSCHEREAAEFATSSHARAMHTLESSQLFAATAPAAREACLGCHATGYEHTDGSVGSCNHCHSGHEFSAEQARQPGACTLCHTGDDYPQDRAYSLSKHGVLFDQTGDERIAPTCATCHHPGGSHADGFGITIGGSGTGGILSGHDAPVAMEVVSPAEFTEAREAMVGVCAECHSTRFSKDSLARADAIKREGTALLAEARAILEALHAEGLLGAPPPAQLPLGGEQILAGAATPGAQILNRFYVMWRFHYAATWKGAYHNSFSIANLSSGPGLKEDLDFIASEAARLRADR